MKICKFFSGLLMTLFPMVICQGQEPATPTAKKAGEDKTEIYSDNLVMVSGEKGNHFLFTGNVEVHATNMVATCQRLEVYSGKEKQQKTKAPAPVTEKEKKGSIGKIEKILAMGSVRIVQQERVATAGKAEIYPQEGRVVLLESPIVTDKQGKLEGFRITLLQGEQKVLVEKGPGQRPKITLPQIPDLGIGGNKKEPSGGKVNKDN